MKNFNVIADLVDWIDEETQHFKGKNALTILDFSDRGFADNKERSRF